MSVDLNTTSAAEKGKSKSVVAKADNLGTGTMFPGTGTGAIPDRPAPGCGLPAGANRDVSFAVTGLPAAAPGSVSLSMTATHTWVGDLDASLIAPDGTTHVVFAGTNSITTTDCGSSGDLVGAYTFNNSGATNWWGFDNLNIPVGTYQTVTPGDVASGGGVPTDIDAAFAGIPDQNGTWILRVNDSGGGDTGSVTAASLTLTPAAPSGSVFMDFDGDGTADYVQARDVTPPPSLAKGDNSFFTAKSGRERAQILKDNPMPVDYAAPEGQGANIGWFVHSSQSSTDTFTGLGQPATDFIVPRDYDGDGKADIAVWRGSAAPNFAFYILDSSTMTVRQEIFGQSSDNPVVAGDYDGDGKADVAVYRCPPTAGQCTYFYKGSAGTGGTTFVPWGNGTPSTLFASTGDFDGDGKHDFCIQRTNPSQPGKGQFVLLRSSDFGVEFINWGNNTDLILPGDYDGDGKDDIAVGRNQSGTRHWYVLERDGGIIYGIPFGLNTDFVTPADFDGDGKTDFAVWRPNAGDPNANFFWVLRSSDSMVSTFEYGQAGDYPPANSQVQ